MIELAGVLNTCTFKRVIITVVRYLRKYEYISEGNRRYNTEPSPTLELKNVWEGRN